MQRICKGHKEDHLSSLLSSWMEKQQKAMRCVSKKGFIINILFNFPAHFFLPFHNVKRSVFGCDHPAPLFGSHYLTTAASEARNYSGLALLLL